MDQASVEKRMDEVINLVKSDIATIRTGRAAPSLVEDIVVDAYGGQSRLRVQELATITAPDTQTLVIDPYDKSIIGDIRKGIEAANIGLTPSIDGEIIRISLPLMTTEDRERYVKLLSQKLEHGKVMVRQIRGDAMKDIKDAFEKKELTEDEKFDSEKKLQEITDKYTSKVDEMGEVKKKELLQI